MQRERKTEKKEPTQHQAKSRRRRTVQGKDIVAPAPATNTPRGYTNKTHTHTHTYKKSVLPTSMARVMSGIAYSSHDRIYSVSSPRAHLEPPHSDTSLLKTSPPPSTSSTSSACAATSRDTKGSFAKISPTKSMSASADVLLVTRETARGESRTGKCTAAVVHGCSHILVGYESSKRARCGVGSTHNDVNVAFGWAWKRSEQGFRVRGAGDIIYYCSAERVGM